MPLPPEQDAEFPLSRGSAICYILAPFTRDETELTRNALE